MYDGFIKVAACTPEIKVADVEFNKNQIINQIKKCHENDVKIAVFPELCITGYTCGDLFFQDTLITNAVKAVAEIAEETTGMNMLVCVGTPVKARGKLYNCAAVIYEGQICIFIPKTNLPNYNEFYEQRQFTAFDGKTEYVNVSYAFDDGETHVIPMSQTVISFYDIPELKIGFEICEDLWVKTPVSNYLADYGANIICNLSASNETIGKEKYRRELVSSQSARLIAGYIYASAGNGESTQDLVFSGHNIIAENGNILAESKLFENGIIMSEIDIKKLSYERRKISTYSASAPFEDYSPENFPGNISTTMINLKLDVTKCALTRDFPKTPFVPGDESEKNYRCNMILKMQSHGLMKRIEHTNAKSVVIGISGGLDSTLALLVCVMAMDLLKRPHTDIIAVTMPCFGTTKRTRSNAEILCNELDVTFREVNITKSVRQHFEDISHDESVHDVTYENSQARERTQVIMDIANKCGGLVIGTGDLSELALGWATYNGDHMSMYGVNASIPKTLVRYIVKYYADTTKSEKLSEVLYDILDTPVSPELLPTDESHTEITQKTEDLVGPYELHDFFLYYALRWGFSPSKVYRIAKYSFAGEYSDDVIFKWLKTFYRRFFSQQFKRSCLPDSPKVGSVTLSPRGDLRMPSDACSKLWLDELDKIENERK